MGSALRAVAAFAAVAMAVTGCSGDGERHGNGGATGGGRVRTYYIAADPVVWDYAPTGRDEITGKPFDEAARVFVAPGPGRIGSRYQKCLYRGYTDRSFRTLVERGPAEQHLGFLGPVIRAEVGDTITVVFRNNCPFPASMHPHGVSYTKAHEGAGYADGTRAGDKADDAVPPGGSHTYTWHVGESAGPGPMDGSSVVWMYHSHADEISDVYAGLSGFLVVTAAGKARRDGSPADVDREVFALFEVVDENASPFLDDNIERFVKGPEPDTEDEGFVESNLMHAINGFVYGTGPVVTMRRGERVRWYLMGMGTEVDLHTPHWHGNTATINGMRTDVANLLPASMFVADMRPEAVGTWLFHCHVGDHIAAGMLTRYRVVP